MQNPTFALIIGIDDYRSFDPSGASDLRGATNDVKAWWRLCRGHLQIDAKNIRILSRTRTGAPITAEQLIGPDADGVTITDATRADIIAGIEWLGEQVRTHSGAGLVTCSGHGVGLRAAQLSEEGSTEALAPAGMTALTLDQLFTSADYNAAIQASGGDQETISRITNIFDACYDRSADAAASRSLGGLEDVALPPRVLSRLMLSCQLFESSYEIQMNGRWRGAFTHSVQTLMERWRTAVDDQTGVRYLQCSYDDLIFRSREHLALLGVPQTPTLVSRFARSALIPVLRPGNHLAEGDTVSVPNAPMRREEFSPGNEGVVMTIVEVLVTLKGSNPPPPQTFAVGIITGDVASDGQYAGQFQPNTEYWRFNTELIKGAIGTGFANPRTCTGTVYTAWPTTTIPAIEDSAGFTQQVSWPIGMSWVPVLQSPPSYQSTQGVHITGCWGNSGNNTPSLDDNGQGFAMQFTWKKQNPGKGCIVRMDTYATPPSGESIQPILLNGSTTDASTRSVTINGLNSATIAPPSWYTISVSVPAP